MENYVEIEVEDFDMTSDVKSDTFVNEDYEEAVVHNIGRFIEAKNKAQLKRKAEERLALID